MNIGDKIQAKLINSGYGQDYGYEEYYIRDIAFEGNMINALVLEPMANKYQQLRAWYRGGEWVVDLD